MNILSSSGMRPHDRATSRQFSTEQMDQILNAILSGKYSWACALILQFTGHEPLHYLPQRTYTRIMRDNVYAPDKPGSSDNSGLLADLKPRDLSDTEANQLQGGFSAWFAAPDYPGGFYRTPELLKPRSI
jgi:hypothetical protein